MDSQTLKKISIEFFGKKAQSKFFYNITTVISWLHYIKGNLGQQLEKFFLKLHYIIPR